jgi:methanogenic corrinoid protein MtbC1/DNA-binding Xre family transcriptional regulator
MVESQIKTFQKLLLESLLKGDSQAVGNILDESLDSEISLQTLYVDILPGVQCAIGDMWINGKISIAEEHRATQIVLEHLPRIRQNIRPRKPLGVKAVIASLPGDQHFLGGRIISDLLILDGWEVDFLGADTPIDDIVNHAKNVNATLVGLSLSDSSYLTTAREVILKLKASMQDIKIIVGGRGVMKKEEANTIGADVIVSDGSQTINEARKIAGIEGSANALYQTLGEIGAKIHHYRKSQKMSQEKLSAGSGLDRAYISSVENGKQNVTIGALLKLADALGVDLSDLINHNTQQKTTSLNA